MSDGSSAAGDRPVLEPLSGDAVRVLGSLVEKEITTPDNYPLTVNAIITACNQTSNRDPVLTLDESAVARSLDELMRRSLARAVHRSDSRATRYRHLLAETLQLHAAEIAALCVLLLRGAQTSGEVRTRSARLFEFIDLAHVEITLQSLMTLEPPLVALLPRRPGQKEARYAHLLSGEPVVAETVDDGRTAETAPAQGRVDALEQEIAALRTELSELRERFDAFAREFQ
jgi:uncharacterized protein